VLISACNIDRNSNQTFKSERINGIEVPPEPDPQQNNATPKGIDINQNGIRDDVERFIAQKWGKDQKTYALAITQAKAMQTIITNYYPIPSKDEAIDPKRIKALDKAKEEIFDFLSCNKTPEAEEISQNILIPFTEKGNLVLNTNMRQQPFKGVQLAIAMSPMNCHKKFNFILAPNKNILEINGITVPPEPDESEKDATPKGIDSNHNGIRDDAERRIAEIWGNDPDAYFLALEESKAMQTLIEIYEPGVIFTDSSPTINAAKNIIINISSCQSRFHLSERFEGLETLVVNTRERRRAFYPMIGGIVVGASHCKPYPNNKYHTQASSSQSH
jgi:hypothetical protein